MELTGVGRLIAQACERAARLVRIRTKGKDGQFPESEVFRACRTLELYTQFSPAQQSSSNLWYSLYNDDDDEEEKEQQQQTTRYCLVSSSSDKWKVVKKCDSTKEEEVTIVSWKVHDVFRVVQIATTGTTMLGIRNQTIGFVVTNKLPTLWYTPEYTRICEDKSQWTHVQMLSISPDTCDEWTCLIYGEVWASREMLPLTVRWNKTPNTRGQFMAFIKRAATLDEQEAFHASEEVVAMRSFAILDVRSTSSLDSNSYQFEEQRMICNCSDTQTQIPDEVFDEIYRPSCLCLLSEIDDMSRELLACLSVYK